MRSSGCCQIRSESALVCLCLLRSKTLPQQPLRVGQSVAFPAASEEQASCATDITPHKGTNPASPSLGGQRLPELVDGGFNLRL